MRIFTITALSIAMLASRALIGQESAALNHAQDLDQEIAKAKDLPDDLRQRAIQDLARRVPAQPTAYLAALAFNLAVSASEMPDHNTVEAVANTLVDALRRSPTEKRTDDLYETLAEWVRYYHANVTFNDPRFVAAITRLEADDKERNRADFTLRDLEGHEWNLKRLRGKVVLVNFWETWCPPCRREIPDLADLHSRFHDKGLVVLAISSEDEATVTKFVWRQSVNYPVLLDPEGKVKDLFRVKGFPVSFVYDREGRLVGETIDRPSPAGWLQLLGKAGLK